MKKGLALLGLLGCAAALLSLTACRAPAPLLTVDGQEIGEKEYRAFMQQNVAATVRYFQTTYACDYTADFWHSSPGGESPAEHLRQAVVNELVRCKVQEQLLREEGLWPFESYESFLRGLEQENDRRERAAAAGEVIYGPTVYGEREYYQYLLANGLTRLKQEYVRRQVIDTRRETLEVFFEQNPQLVSQPYAAVRLKLLRYPYAAEDGTIQSGAKEEAYQAALAGAALLEGREMEEIPALQGHGELAEMHFSNESARSDSLLMPQVFAWAQAKAPDEQSGVLEDNGAYWIAQLLEKQAAAPVRFEDVRDFISAKYVDRCFDELVRQAADRAQVKLLAADLPLPGAE